MITKSTQSALAAAIFTAMLASTSIPAYASAHAGGSHSEGHFEGHSDGHSDGHGPIAPPHGGQKGGGTLISCHPGGCTETKVKGSGQKGRGTLVSCSPGSGCTATQLKDPAIYQNVPAAPTQTVTGSGTNSIQGQINGALGIGNGHPTPSTSALQGEINGALGIGNKVSGVPPKQVVGIASGSNCALFGCASAPPAPTPPTGSGNPPKHGGDRDHNDPGIVIEGAPGEVVVPAPVVAAPVASAPVVAARAAVAAPQVVQAPCNCLTKQTLSDGSVLFQDLCTKEAAIAAPPSASVR